MGKSIKERQTMKLSIANHNNEKNPNGFINYDVEFSDIPEIVKSGYCYSACSFKDDYRKDDNYTGNEYVLILDIDSDCTIDQAKEIFKQYNFFIITTKSHNKEKNGVVCDRFRIFIELDEIINCSIKRESFINNIMTRYPFCDSSCRNRSRFFYSSPNDAIVISNKGNKMKVISSKIDFKAPIKQKQAISNTNTRGVYKLNELSGLWINEYGETLEHTDGEISEQSKLKGAITILDREFVKGQRNHTMFKVAAMLLKDGLDQDSVANFLIEENNRRDGMPLNELIACIKSAVRTI